MNAEAEAHEDAPLAARSYRDLSRELEAIVAELEGMDVDVDRVGALYERAVQVMEELDRRLRSAEVRVEQLTERLADLGAERRQGAPRAPASSQSSQGPEEPF